MSDHIDGYDTTDKLTRRKVFKNAVAVGISSAAAMNFTVDDARAADSDQVLISLDTEGRHKEYVPQDWYERVLDAREANRKITNNHINKEGVVSCGYSPGKHGGENPHVIVGLDQNSDKKEKRRGEIPERANKTRVEVRESSKGKPHCNPTYLDSSDTPGGLQIVGYDVDSGYGQCSLTSRMMNGSQKSFPFGWATAAHCIPCPENWDGQTQKFWHSADGNKRTIGWVALVDISLDVAVIAKYDGVNELSEVAPTDSPGTSIWWEHITGTLTDDGLAELKSRGTTFKKRGRSTCETYGEITEIGTTQLVWQYFGGKYCVNQLEKQVKWDGHTKEGDSGSLIYSEPVNGNRYASHLHSGSPDEDGLVGAYGPAGYAIRDEHNCWWSDQ